MAPAEFRSWAPVYFSSLQPAPRYGLGVDQTNERLRHVMAGGTSEQDTKDARSSEFDKSL